MSIFDMFTQALAPTQPAPAPAPAPAQQSQQSQQSPTNPGNMPANAAPNEANQAPNTAPNGTVPAAVEPAQALSDSPLAEFETLWQNDPTKQSDTPNTPVPLDAAAVQKAVANTNFAAGITPETLAAITAGGEGAAEAFMQAINQSAQQVMVQSTMVNNKLTEKAVADAIAAQQASLPDLVRSQQVSSHLNDTNPLFSNPAIKPVIEATQAQLMQKYPTATPQQLTEMTQNYITQMGKAFAPAAAVNDNSVVGGTDWDAFYSHKG